MDFQHALKEIVPAYLLFIPLLTFHEWAHAWTAWKCGDDTAYQRGRVSLNPIVHMELVGTVLLPLAGMISGAMGAGFVLIGWGKPVPVDPMNLKHPRVQDSLIAMAGPAMNLVLAFVLLLIAKPLIGAHQYQIANVFTTAAQLSLFLCFFNLLPIPPLDGSHLLLNVTRMSYETYARLAMFGFVAVIILIQFKAVRGFLVNVVNHVFVLMGKILGLA